MTGNSGPYSKIGKSMKIPRPGDLKGDRMGGKEKALLVISTVTVKGEGVICRGRHGHLYSYVKLYLPFHGH